MNFLHRLTSTASVSLERRPICRGSRRCRGPKWSRVGRRNRVTQPRIRIIGPFTSGCSLLGAAGLARDPTRGAFAHAQLVLAHGGKTLTNPAHPLGRFDSQICCCSPNKHQSSELLGLRVDLVLGHRLNAILRCGHVAFSQDESGWPFHRLFEVVGIGEDPDRVATTKTLNPL